MKLVTYTAKPKGVTLLELMTVLAIVAIISQLTLSYYPDFLANNRADNQVHKLLRTLNLSRLYAIENNTFVTICAMESSTCLKGHWQRGFSAFVDNNKSLSVDGDERVLVTFSHQHSADRLKYPRNAITFRPDGTINGFNNGTFTYCPNYKQGELAGHALSVSQTGRIRVKSTQKCLMAGSKN